MSTVSAPSAAGITTWNIDNSHTLAEFSVRHLMISSVKGRFGEVSLSSRGIHTARLGAP